MRIGATTTDKGVHLAFHNSPADGTGDSVHIKHSEVAKLSVMDGMLVLFAKLADILFPDMDEVEPEEEKYSQRDGDGTFGPKGIVETEIIKPPKGIIEVEIVEVPSAALEVELDGDEDDEDLSVFEVEVPVKGYSDKE